MSTELSHLPAFAKRGVNLASAGLGAKGVSCTDEFFAPLERMLQDAPAIFIPDKFDDHGKWMDGWETRRRRDGGYDHAIIRLAVPGQIFGFDVDTAHFTGNYAPAVRIEGLLSKDDPSSEDAGWVEVLPASQLSASAHHFLEAGAEGTFSHLKISIFPDGGVARLRVYGKPQLDTSSVDGEIDLASALNGGHIVAFSDAHYGAYHRLLAPGRGENMGDGWETRRLREPGHDWIIVALGSRGRVARAVVDTAFFKGNFPDRCSLQGADLSAFSGDLEDAVVTSSMFWQSMLAEQKLTADAVHEFADEVTDIGPITHVRFNIFPDGGVSRLRLFGKLA